MVRGGDLFRGGTNDGVTGPQVGKEEMKSIPVGVHTEIRSQVGVKRMHNEYPSALCLIQRFNLPYL